MTINLLSKKCTASQNTYRILPSKNFYNPTTQLYNWEEAKKYDIEAYKSTLCGSSSGDAYGSCGDDNSADDAGSY